jgi:hypothetical protein
MTRIIDAFVADMKLIGHTPRFQIIITHGVLELLVNTLIELRCKNGGKIRKATRDYPHSVKLVLLHEKGLIKDSHYRLLDGFRKLRNEAVHDAQFNLKPEMLTPFQSFFATDKRHKLNDPKNFSVLCGKIVLLFWNHRLNDFWPYFDPDLFGKQNGIPKDTLPLDGGKKRAKKKEAK